MEIKKSLYLFLASLLLMTGFSSCNSDDPVTLSLGVKEIYLKMGEDATVYIYSGNGGYTFSVDNENIVTATLKDRTVTFTPVSKGKTTFTMEDSEKKITKVTINVVDPYMAYVVTEINSANVTASNTSTASTIKTEMEKTPSMLKGHAYDLTRNASKSYVVHEKDWSSTPVSAGTYTFDEGNMFTLKSGGTEHTYILEENNEFAKKFYEYFTKDSSTGTGSSSTQAVFTITEDLTEVYKAKYPDAGVTKATISAKVLLYTYKSVLDESIYY